MSATAEIINEDLRVHFSAPWDLDGHALFLRAKGLPEARCTFDRKSDSYTLTAPARFAHIVGLEPPVVHGTVLPLPDWMFDYQRWVVSKAIEAKRFAAWEDCGLGKTVQFLEFARQVRNKTNGRNLICSPKQIIRQTCAEAERFYGDEVRPRILRTREELQDWCRNGPEPYGITNYEKFIPGPIDELRWCAGVEADESSVLKSGGGVIKWNLIKSCRGIEYKLSCTATPAPNDTIEYASQASWLEKMRTDNEIIWTYFQRDPRTQEWKVRPHAREAFYRFMSSWSIYLRRPSTYGFADKWNLPEPEIIEHKLPMNGQQADWARKLLAEGKGGNAELLAKERLGVRERSKLSQVAKGFVYRDDKSAERVESAKPECVAKLMATAVSEGRHPLCWTVFDEESDIILEQLKGLPVVGLHGKDKEEEREEKLEAYRTGQIGGLISKGRLLGYGMNFPFCSSMVFSGFDDSFEQFYQAVRRAHRYGATQRLTVHVPYIPELERHMWENLLRKKAQWEADAAIQEENYARAMKEAA